MVKAAKKKTMTFVIDCSKPCEDNIMQIDVFMKYLSDRIKVNGKAGVLGDVVKVTREKTKVVVASEIDMSKRYLKYLTKKFLKKHNVRDWIRVIEGAEGAEIWGKAGPPGQNVLRRRHRHLARRCPTCPPPPFPSPPCRESPRDGRAAPRTGCPNKTDAPWRRSGAQPGGGRARGEMGGGNLSKSQKARESALPSPMNKKF